MKGTTNAIPIGQGRRDQLTRNEAARMLGVNVSTIRRWEGSKLPIASRDPDGTRRFRAADVERLRAETEAAPPRPRRRVDPRLPGEIAAAAFRLLDDGADQRELVRRLEIAPVDAARLATDWAGAGGVVLAPPDVERIRRFCAAGRPVTGETIAAALVGLTSSVRVERRRVAALAEAFRAAAPAEHARFEATRGDRDRAIARTVEADLASRTTTQTPEHHHAEEERHHDRVPPGGRAARVDGQGPADDGTPGGERRVPPGRGAARVDEEAQAVGARDDVKGGNVR